MSWEAPQPTSPCSRVFSHVLSSPFISKTCYFLSFPPTLTPVSFFLFFLVSHGSAVALEGRGRCLHGPGVCSVALLLHAHSSAPCPSASGDPHLRPSCFPLFSQAQRHISDLYEDLRDGHNLISLLEVLSGDSLVCVSVSTFLPSLGPSSSSHSVSSSVSHHLQPSPAPTAPSWPRLWHHSLSPGRAGPVGGHDPRHSPHFSSNTVTSRSALLWFLCCLDSES